MLAALWCVDDTDALPVFLFAALVHELGHLLTLKISGGRFYKISLNLCGAVIRCKLPESRFAKAAVCLAGPAASFGLAYFAGLLGFYRIAGASVILGTFNMLPLPPLDGAMVLEHLADGRFKTPLQILGGTSAALLLAAGMWLVFKGGGCWLLFTGVILCMNGVKNIKRTGNGKKG